MSVIAGIYSVTLLRIRTEPGRKEAQRKRTKLMGHRLEAGEDIGAQAILELRARLCGTRHVAGMRMRPWGCIVRNRRKAA